MVVTIPSGREETPRLNPKRAASHDRQDSVSETFGPVFKRTSVNVTFSLQQSPADPSGPGSSVGFSMSGVPYLLVVSPVNIPYVRPLA
jgi:hypothetical protein